MHFYKYQGTGNDFIIFDNRNRSVKLDGEAIRFLCSRKYGIGADGLMLLQLKDGCDFEMKYFNCDGIEATMCGNGGRCIVSFASKLGIIDNSCIFLASDGKHHAEIKAGIIRLGMQDVCKIDKYGNDYFLDTGNPKYVIFCENIDLIDIISESRNIRYDSRFQPAGTNVNYAELKNNRLIVRTYEKGVENETLSCGTGVIASAIAASVRYNISGEIFEVSTKGGMLKVYFEKKGNTFRNIYLEGPALFVFEGDIILF